MSKQLVETTGQFELVDFEQNMLVIKADRPTVVSPTVFISTRAAAQQIKFLANLNDDATDEEFEKYWKEADADSRLAIDAFLSSYGDQVEKQAESAPAPRRGRKKADEDEPTPAPVPEDKVE